MRLQHPGTAPADSAKVGRGDGALPPPIGRAPPGSVLVAETTSPPARVERKLKIRGLIVSLTNRTEPSQNRKLQPPGWRLQKSSAPGALVIRHVDPALVGRRPGVAEDHHVGGSRIPGSASSGLVQTCAYGIDADPGGVGDVPRPLAGHQRRARCRPGCRGRRPGCCGRRRRCSCAGNSSTSNWPAEADVLARATGRSTSTCPRRPSSVDRPSPPVRAGAEEDREADASRTVREAGTVIGRLKFAAL